MVARILISSFFVSAVLSGVSGWAQTAAPQAPGSVTGSVYCADTNRPARLARVVIEPVEDFNPPVVDAKGNISRTTVPSTTLTETGADGGYSFQNVAPGQYYIVAELPGYLSPLIKFTSEELQLPTEQETRRFRETLERVTVLSGQTARMDFRLDRGAAIEGRVLYDDGSPTTGAMVFVLRRDEKLGWVPIPDTALDRFKNAPMTDDRGRYRVAMLAPGEYTVGVDIPHVTITTGGAVFPPTMISREAAGGTPVYFGDVTNQANAKSVTLNRADEYSGADITIPMRKLHTVSGTIVAASDGHAIDVATVSLVDAVKGNSVKETGVSPGTGRFTMSFIPEGRYLVKVTNAADGIFETEPVLPGTQMTSSHFIPRHLYADTELPLQVGADTPGLVLKVPEPNQHH